jgi:Flp pilus assembly protein TadD
VAEAFREALAQAEPEAGTQDRINALRGLATQLKEAGSYAEAAEAYAQALEFRPDDNQLAYLRADALYLAGNGLEALPILTELEQESSDYRVNALIADIYTDQGQIDYALRSLERALRKAETAGNAEAQADILVKLGLLQRDLGRDSEAAASFRQATEVDPASWEAAYNLGVSLLESGQTRSALDPLERAAEIAPENGQVQLALATAYDQLAMPNEALQAARQAASTLQDADLLARARFILGRSLYQQGDYSAAATTLQQVVEAMPNNAQAQLWAGLAEYQRGNYRQAALLYERASQLDPSSIEARVNLGAAYLASERFQDAERVYRSLTEQNPRDAESYYNLGWSVLAQERRGAARDAWGTSCDLGYQPACDALSRYF